jgi:hypothetical protein
VVNTFRQLSIVIFSFFDCIFILLGPTCPMCYMYYDDMALISFQLSLYCEGGSMGKQVE